MNFEQSDDLCEKKHPGYTYHLDIIGYNINLSYRCRTDFTAFLYFITDSFSKMITGIYSAVEITMSKGDCMALINTLEDKACFCEQYGILTNEKEWPSGQLPNRLVTEICTDDDTIKLLKNYDVKISYPNFSTSLHTAMKYLINLKEKLEKLEKLTLEEFTKIIIHEVLKYNNSPLKTSSTYNKIAFFRPTPVSLWEWGNKNLDCNSNICDINKTILEMLPRGQAVIKRGGLSFNGLYFSKEIKEYNLLEKTNELVSIAFDPRDDSKIYVPIGNNQFITCKLLTSESR